MITPAKLYILGSVIKLNRNIPWMKCHKSLVSVVQYY